MKILRFVAEHVKRIAVIEITPTGHVVEITGKNGQGKTSVLDSIWWALAGTRTHQPEPINRDHREARIKLDLGELIVEREFKRQPPAPGRQDERITTRITVQNAKGEDLRSPQTILDKLLGSLSFDPLAFARKDEADQYRILQGVCGIDMEESDRQDEQDYVARRIANRTAKDRRAAAGQIHVPTPMPERVDLRELVADRQRREKRNVSIRRSDDLRAKLERLIDESQKRAQNATDAVTTGEATITSRTEKLAQDIQRVRDECERKIAKLTTDCSGRVEQLQEQVDKSAAAAKGFTLGWQASTKELDAMPELPKPETFDDLDEQFEQAEATNRIAEEAERQADTVKRLNQEAQSAEFASQRLTGEMDERKHGAADAVEKAALPIPGLALEHGRVALHGLPFSQASDADQLRASCAIAMRGDQELRVIRVRDGSLLDEDSMKILAEMAADADYQVWIEMVDSRGEGGIVIEDGRVKAS